MHAPPPPDVKALVMEDMKEVLWSEEKGVPENILARPHTSNPRYVEMHMRDTPRKVSLTLEEPPARPRRSTTVNIHRSSSSSSRLAFCGPAGIPTP